MNTRMIDVAIGLVLVFALTSLLVTALQEIWSSLRGLRGRYLFRAVQSFFGDDLKFTEGLLRHPLVVSLSNQTKDQQRRPSYMAADVLITSLVAHLSEQHAGGLRPSTPGEFVALVKAAAQRAGAEPSASVPNADFVRGLNSLVMGVEQDWPAYEARLAAWYDSVGTRSIGWFKRHTQVTLFVFGLLAAGIANINPIVIAARLWQDEALRKATVAVAEKVSAEYAAQAASGVASAASGAVSLPALVPMGASAPAQVAAQSPAQVQAKPEDRLAELSAGVQAALKQTTTGATATALEGALRGVIELRAAFKASPVDEARIKALSDKVAAQLPPGPAHQALRDSHARLTAALVKAPPQAAPAQAPPASAAAARLPRDCAAKPEGAARDYCLRMNDLGALQTAGLPIGWDGGAWPTLFKDECDLTDAAGKSPAACESKVRPASSAWWGNLLVSLLGWCLTAVACTLGAPFWFDALSQLVKLRSSGGQSSSGGGGAASEAPKTMLARSPATAEAAASPPEAGGAAAMSDAFNDAEQALSVAEVERLQRGLGLSGVQVSGHFDGATRQAIKQWQTSRGFEATAELTALQIQDLLGLAPGSDDDGYLA